MDKIIHLWNQYSPDLRMYANAKVKNSADADDILQEVFIKISIHQDKVLGAHDARNYMFGITKNAIAKFYKEKHKIDPSLLPEMSLVPGEELHNVNEIVSQLCVRPLIELLPEHYREAILVSEINDVPQVELAKKLNISYSCLKSRVQRGREKLKALLLERCYVKSDVYGNLSCIDNECDVCY